MKNCSDLLTSGFCHNSKCTLNHRILFCDVCNFSARNSAGLSSHVRSDKHRRVVAEAVANDAQKDRNNVVIEGDLDFGILEQDIARKGLTKSLHIHSVEPSSQIILASVKLRPIAPVRLKNTKSS